MDNNIVLNLPTLSYIVVGGASIIFTLLLAIIGFLVRLLWSSFKDFSSKVVDGLEKLNENHTDQRIKNVEMQGALNAVKTTANEAKSTANRAYDMVREVKNASKGKEQND